ncbi:LysR family transcriptional regulator [Enterococcus caccae]|uniref:HTH lysR-type domain-containing protein n=1 Tax=Enterococcus caccae ATCC BAA-1240 TaxID=1158612 RepID=R3X156_9ENTE|nr:LysR family transcriptional regulator [Enterococcus caccae]EOL47755.1 hypothetical protein UC7_01005 [Enterococcus caccae ATCC BAA-1240]EOT65553.1 hypothetical protein I580_01309 [Enterococcus caccae ATCC BAA-1240]OJG27265.1 hypothetical protein RU98_GL002717 [Enterococcus caccae]
MFKLLKTFRIVYETKNFSKAAERLFISQPAVSNQIKQLEEELTIQLFMRNGRQEIITTKQADILYNHLLNLADDWEDVLQALQVHTNSRETCRIVASNTFAVYYLPELIDQLVQQFPEVSFILDMDNSEQVLDRIEKHQAHFGFIEKPLITESIIRKKIVSDELVHAGDFSKDLWLVREEHSGVFHYTERYFLAQNLDPQKMIIKNNEMIVKCLEQGIGQSIISKRALTEKIKWKPLEQEYQRNFYFIKRQHIESSQLSEIDLYINEYYQVK